MAWDLYYSLYGKTPSSTLKDKLSGEEWAFYEPKVERCRRLEDKSDQIKQEVKAHRNREMIQYMMEEEQLLNDESLKDDPVIKKHKDEKRKAMLSQTKL